MKYIFCLVFVFSKGLVLDGFAQDSTDTKTTISNLRFLDEYIIPYDFKFKNTTVGGLSGIDYSPQEDVFFCISDDRSSINVARYYTFKMYHTATDIDTVIFQDVTNLLRPGTAAPYPSYRHFPAIAPDPESIRLNAITDQLYWSDEGERIVRDNTLKSPSIYVMRRDGQVVDSLTLPANLQMKTSENGPRRNGTIESLSFADNFSKILFCLEEPLFEDGPQADVHNTASYIRIYRGDSSPANKWEQFAYKLDPVEHTPLRPPDFRINGVSEMLCLSSDKILMVERSFTTGRATCTVKVFLADLSGAHDISAVSSLGNTPGFVPARKSLILNMDYLGIHIDNIEGVTFGPRLPNGHQTLVFISDNNFRSIQRTQILFFEIIP